MYIDLFRTKLPKHELKSDYTQCLQMTMYSMYEYFKRNKGYLVLCQN